MRAAGLAVCAATAAFFLYAPAGVAQANYIQ